MPPSVDGQCFHLRRLDLQILLLCRCLAQLLTIALRVRVDQSESFLVITYPWGNVSKEFVT